MSSNNKKYNFSGKVAIVTGSSSGIGAAVAIQLAQYGARLTITGRDGATLNKVAQQIVQVSNGVKPLQLIGNLPDDRLFPQKLINETVNNFGRLDILVNNVGYSEIGTLSSSKLLQEFDEAVQLNVRIPVELTQLAAAHLEKTKGTVVNISSALSVIPFGIVYSTTKAALDMVTKCSALELGPKGIRVNSINPGLVETNFGRSYGWDKEFQKKFFAERAKQSLLKRVGQVEDIANLVSFLASDDAKNITGSSYFTDSGALIYPPKPLKKE